MIHDKAHSRTPGSQRVRQDSGPWSPILYIHHWTRAISDMSVNRSVAPDPRNTSGCCRKIENVTSSTVNQQNKTVRQGFSPGIPNPAVWSQAGTKRAMIGKDLTTYWICNLLPPQLLLPRSFLFDFVLYVDISWLMWQRWSVHARTRETVCIQSSVLLRRTFSAPHSPVLNLVCQMESKILWTLPLITIWKRAHRGYL